MKVLHLPPALLLALFAYVNEATPTAPATPATPAPSITQFPNKTSAYPLPSPSSSPSPSPSPSSLPSTGSGSEYASACQAALSSYSAGSRAWQRAVQRVSNTTQLEGGPTTSIYTLYENATTLCDKHPRVTYSPAKSIGIVTSTYSGPITGTTIIAYTDFYGTYPSPSPTCSISPEDCDPLWADYSKSLSAASTMTAPPTLFTPPCANQSVAAQYSSATAKIYGCGECTIYGQGVELVYFPTSAERDMCATTPTASLTSYGPGAVITAYAGKNYRGPGAVNGSKTVVVDGHTFTSGTAYISISTVYAVDRCSHTHGTPVTDAILAMPSESVLSLRYRQDRFQRLLETDKITGYPVSYADFNTPIPWSAWNGQNICQGPYDTSNCGIIYENNFRPQLAIPPGITQLSPDFKGCQLWYNGLWDPPLRLTEVDSAARPTLPTYHQTKETSAPGAAPSAPVPALTARPTALPNELPSSSNAGNQPSQPAYGASLPTAAFSGQPPETAVPAVPPNRPGQSGNGYNPRTTAITIGGQVETVAQSGYGGAVVVGTVTLNPGGAASTLPNGQVVSAASEGLVINSPATDTEDSEGTRAITATIGGHVETAIQNQPGGPIVIDNTITLAPGAFTTLNGEIITAASNGLVFGGSTTVGVEAQATGVNVFSQDVSGSTPSSTGGSQSSNAPSDTDEGASSSTGAAMQTLERVNIAAVVAILVAALAV